MAPSVQLRKYSQHSRLANDNDTTDQIPAIIDTANSNGVAAELFPIVQAPITLLNDVAQFSARVLCAHVN